MCVVKKRKFSACWVVCTSSGTNLADLYQKMNESRHVVK